MPRIQARLREIATRERTALASLTEVMDSIVVYAIDQDNGQFTLVKIVPTSGANPRNFGLDPTDTCLSVGNHSTDDIFTFRVDPDTDQFTQKCMGLFNFAFAGRPYL